MTVTPCTIGTPKTKTRVYTWEYEEATYNVITSTTPADPGAYVYLDSTPTPSWPDGIAVITLPTAAPAEVANNIELGFFGRGDATQAGSAQVWGLSEIEGNSGKYLGTYLGTFEFVLGAATVSADGPFTSYTYNFAGTINVQDEFGITPPGVRLTGNHPDARGGVILDSAGFTYIVVVLDKGDVTTGVGLTWRPL